MTTLEGNPRSRPSTPPTNGCRCRTAAADSTRARKPGVPTMCRREALRRKTPRGRTDTYSRPQLNMFTNHCDSQTCILSDKAHVFVSTTWSHSQQTRPLWNRLRVVLLHSLLLIHRSLPGLQLREAIQNGSVVALNHLQGRVSMGVGNRRFIARNELGLHSIPLRNPYSVGLVQILHHLQLLRSLLLHELLQLLGSSKGSAEVLVENVVPGVQHHLDLDECLLIGILRQIPTNQKPLA